jgi:hypothetical protein
MPQALNLRIHCPGAATPEDIPLAERAAVDETRGYTVVQPRGIRRRPGL